MINGVMWYDMVKQALDLLMVAVVGIVNRHDLSNDMCHRN